MSLYVTSKYNKVLLSVELSWINGIITFDKTPNSPFSDASDTRF